MSADRGLRRLGALLAAGALVCAALWRLEFASTWCAFAAAASALILVWTGRPEASPCVRKTLGGRSPGL
ncbi:DUF6629 family protein [Streptomyces sp. NPDC054961]